MKTHFVGGGRSIVALGRPMTHLLSLLATPSAVDRGQAVRKNELRKNVQQDPKPVHGRLRFHCQLVSFKLV